MKRIVLWVELLLVTVYLLTGTVWMETDRLFQSQTSFSSIPATALPIQSEHSPKDHSELPELNSGKRTLVESVSKRADSNTKVLALPVTVLILFITAGIVVCSAGRRDRTALITAEGTYDAKLVPKLSV
ncbi:MAG: hypothetical protein IJ225_06810 [Solobacterium sp.]|nr:hypothetical protein [Solobacterium sp.]